MAERVEQSDERCKFCNARIDDPCDVPPVELCEKAVVYWEWI